MTSYNFSAIGTEWQIDIYQKIKKDSLNVIINDLKLIISRYDKLFSRFADDSWVRKNAYKKVKAKIPPYFGELFNFYKTLYDISEGIFTPLIGSVMEQAGYDKTYSLVPKKLFAPPDLGSSVLVDGNYIEFKEKVLLDFGAAGKGYLVDILARQFQNYKITDFCIDASGDILFKGSNNKKIAVGLENPDNPKEVIGVCNLENQSICASSGTRRRWGTFHHTINPKTLLSPTEVKATWVVAKDCMIADGLATSLFLDPFPQKYAGYFKFSCVILYKDNSAYKSGDFPGELFTSK